MGTQPVSKRIRWDEKNLMENEKIKQEMNTTKIDEPKTPFHSPPPEEFEDYLDGESPKETSEEFSRKWNEKWAEAEAAMNGQNREQETEGTEETGEAETSNGHKVGLKFVDGDYDETEEDVAKHKKFQDMRKAHYNMGAALKQGKELLEKDEEDDEEDGNE